MLGDSLGKLLRGASAGAHERDVDILEVVVVLQQFYFVILSAESVFTACTALAAKEHELVDGEVTLVEHFEKFLTYGAAGAHDSYFHLI